MSTVGAASEPPLVALSSRVTVKEAELCSARASRISRRRLETVTLQPASPSQMSASSAVAICVGVTPVGSGVTTAVDWTMTTSTSSAVVLPPEEAAVARLEARVATSSLAATVVSKDTVEVVAKETGA